MFTGLIEEVGRVIEFSEGSRSWRLRVAAERVGEGLAIGDSVSVNGCCLTAVEAENGVLTFDLLGETVRLTSFRALASGSPVNLERSLLPTTRMGGHIVSGHIDSVGTIVTHEARGKDTFIEIQPPAEFLKYLVNKGSIAIDGISLTVAELLPDAFAVWIIPHTLTATNLGAKRVGDVVNLEFDVIAKYVERLLLPGHGASHANLPSENR